MNVKNKDWHKLQEFVAESFREIAPNAKSTKASGGSTIKGDLQGVPNLHVECKDESKLNVFQDKYLQKCIEEIPLHSDKIGLLVTRNENGKVRAHLDFEDFVNLYIELFKYRKGEL